MLGILLLGAGLCFKIAAVPFHVWTPDVYEGRRRRSRPSSRWPEGRRVRDPGAHLLRGLPTLADWGIVSRLAAAR